jgi:uncharacterized membrane protein
VTDRPQSQRFPVKGNSLIQVFVVASVVKAGGDVIRKVIYRPGSICVTNRTQSQRFPLKGNGIIQVVTIASVVKAGRKLSRKGV